MEKSVTLSMRVVTATASTGSRSNIDVYKRQKHDSAYVAQVNLAAADSAHVSTVVIAQLPQNFPGDTHVFVNANHQLLTADIALAHANYDASVIGLASGGYSGS